MSKRWYHYWISAPLTLMTFSKRSGNDLYQFIMVSLLKFFAHLSREQISSLWSLYCLSLYTTSSIRCHTFSMMFRSGLCAGQVKTATLIDFWYSSTFFAVWILALSWCQIHLFWPNYLWHHRIKMVWRSSRHFRLLYLPSIAFITKLPKLEMAPKIMTLPLPIWRYTRCCAMTLSPLCSTHELILSSSSRQKSFSSVKITCLKRCPRYLLLKISDRNLL